MSDWAKSDSRFPLTPTSSVAILLDTYDPVTALTIAADRAAEFAARADSPKIDVDMRLYYQRRASFWSDVADRISEHLPT